MTLTEIFTIIIIHWFADFLMQDKKWAIGKSKNWNDLLSHTIIYSFIWFLFSISSNILSLLVLDWMNLINFTLITFIAHTATDYVTSRIVSKKFAKGEYGTSIPNTGAFTIIGIDQVLHYIQLFLTYDLLKNG
ncbi:MAG TPA: DUF3307 domain-containing protein [Bacteroidales bacterium]|nr:DUF3307 domain-containing protein [Bacteroidales bacterium]